MSQFKTLDVPKFVLQTLRIYFSVNVLGKLSILYKYITSCLYILQPTVNEFYTFTVNKMLIAGCKFQIGQLANVLNRLFVSTLVIETPLYNWYAINTGKLAPKGWLVASTTDYDLLMAYIGGSSQGGKLKEVGTTHWLTPNTNAVDTYGFKAIPNGLREAAGAFYYGTDKKYFNAWSRTEEDSTKAYLYGLEYNNGTFTKTDAFKYTGLVVRCVTYTDPQSTTIKDIDNITYNVVQIGTQWWTVENLRTTHYNDGELIPEITDGLLWEADITGARCYYNNTKTYNTDLIIVNQLVVLSPYLEDVANDALLYGVDIASATELDSFASDIASTSAYIQKGEILIPKDTYTSNEINILATIKQIEITGLEDNYEINTY